MKFFIICVIFYLTGAVNSAFAGKWDNSLELSVTRCFKRKNITVQCNDFSKKNFSKLEIAQELEIVAIDFYEIKRSYGYGKVIEGNLCQIHFRKIQKMIRTVDQVCITGDDEVLIGANETFSRWRELETGKGKVTF